MKPSLRLLKTIVTAPRRAALDPLDEAVTRWRVLPADLDLFGHMNNSRYLQLMDYARVDYLIRCGLLPLVVKNRWMAPVGSTQMDFRRSLAPFAEFEIGTRTVSYDDKWFYMQQTFRTDEDPRPVATGYVKVLFRGSSGPVSPRTVIRLSRADEVPAPALTDEQRAKFGLPQHPVADFGPTPRRTEREPIAIVGIGCRLPGGIDDHEGLWTALLEGTDCIIDIPGSRWDPRRFFDPTGRAAGRTYVQRAGMLTGDPADFDAAFFGIPPREAAILDPQQRLLLECAWEAFEDGGEPPNRHAGGNTGVFIGGFMTDHQLIFGDSINREALTTHSATASTLTMLANRLSYVFDLRGPSVSMDTACSSSLVAIHQACQSIWTGESEAALAGGVNVILSPETQVTMAKGRFLSRSGRCQAFSATADGYVRAEGAAVLLLKPLSAARRDGNTVHAVILGSASNQDGRTNGITVPNGEAQVAAMRKAYVQAGIDPHDVSYVEAHGTGTPVGDPIEARAIGTVVGMHRAGERCRVGSIKTNLGHLEAAAGVAGVIKAALCVKHGVVPPHLHLTEVNPAIDLDALNLEIPTASVPLPRDNGRLIAGVNSFGYGGTNAHVVVAEAPTADGESVPSTSPGDAGAAGNDLLLTLSARSPEALRALAGRHAEMVSDGVADLAAHCRSAAIHRSHHWIRAAFPPSDRSALRETLRAFAETEAAAATPLDSSKVLFVFTGMGPQWWAMGRELLSANQVFRKAVTQCDSIFRDLGGRSILDDMLTDEATSRMSRTEVAQPANTALQIALVELWRSWGVVPDGVLGHSVGELAAAYTANALSLEDTLRVALHRSRLQGRLAGRGAMLAVGLNPAEAADEVERCGGSISVAAVNSSASVTLAGDRDALTGIADRLCAAGRFNRFLQVEVPYHSPVMDDIQAELLDSLQPLRPMATTLATYSTATGTRIGGGHDADYWWRNVRGTVRFADALEVAIDDGHRIFVEIGPHPVLAPSIRDVLGEKGTRGVTISSLRRNAPEVDSMAAALRSVYTAGANVDWHTYFGPGRYTTLPSYPWQRQHLWEEGTRSNLRRVSHDRHPMRAACGDLPAGHFASELSFAEHPFLEDHHVAGAVLFPGAGIVELVLAARHELTQSAVCSIEELEFTSAVTMNADTCTRITTVAALDSPSITVQVMREDADPVVCARAKVFSVGRGRPAVDVAALRARLVEEIDVVGLYDSLAERGLRYGPQFRAVRRAHRALGEVLAELALPPGVPSDGYHLHPVLLDAALHSLIGASDDASRQDLIPVGIQRIQVLDTAPVRFSHGTITHADSAGIRGDLELLAADGTVVVRLTGFTCQVVQTSARNAVAHQRLYRRTWIPYEAVVTPVADALVLDGADLSVAMAELATRVDPVWLIDLRWASAPTETPDPVRDGADFAEQLLDTVAALPPGRVTRYVVVTTRAEAIESDTHAPAVDRAVLLGVARTLMSERPDLAVTLVDLDVEHTAADVIDVLRRVGDEQEIVVRAGELWCARLDRAAPGEATPRERELMPFSADTAFTFELASAGSLDTVGFVHCERGDLADDEVEIEVEYVPLNFKDVLKALGLISLQTSRGTYTERDIGMEVSGRIARVGASVPELHVGDRVYAFYPDALRSHATVPWQRVAPLPGSVSLEQSVGLFAMLTAYYSLVKVARLDRGETVLVHGATGGVGMAAIDVARWCGAEVIATAGSDEKRNHLRALGIDRVADSRDVSFADDVMEWTSGRGVDVVLNFSPGEQMLKGVSSLAPFGRFIEIGKASFDQDAPLGLRPFNENLTYASVDMDRLAASRLDVIAALYREILELMEQGALGSVPVTVFPASRVGEAFRLMARSRHMGKVAVAMRDRELMIRTEPVPPIRSDASYLVTGGLGGFGLETAKWLVAQGARHLVLVSRRGAATDEALDGVRHCEAAGAVVRTYAADVARRDDLAAVLDDVAATMPPLAGIVHSAAVLDDRPIAQQNRASLDRVLEPKAQGAWNLHTLTADLDFFVLYSSISSLIGNPGQANYVAANAALDALAALRRHQCLPASVIQWGVLGDTGMVARNATIGTHLAELGLNALSSTDALAILGEIIRDDVGSVAVVDADWSRLASLAAPMTGDRRLGLLSAVDGSDVDGISAQLMQLFEGLSEEGRRDHLHAALARAVADVMQMDHAALPLTRPLLELGLDSIMGLEIATKIENDLGMRISAVELAAGPSIEQLAHTLLGRLETLHPTQ